MAPEVIEDGQQSVRSDVYSLGVLLYYLVTGEYPVNARTIDELREAHARREHRWLSECGRICRSASCRSSSARLPWIQKTASPTRASFVQR
jgi:serine/threonine protein kinase